MKKNMVLFITSFLLIFAVTNVYIYSNHKQYNAIEDISNLENTYLAFYSLEDNTSLSTLPGPRDGYTLDKDSSYCEVNGIKSNDMSIDLTLDWKIQIHGLTNSRTRCNLYFKKVINLTPFPDDVLAGVIDEEAGTGTPDDNGNGLYKVTPTLDGWTEPELRYAGPDPDNYVWFNCEAGTNSGDTNCEKWRIIGLVNVQTLTGIEQRLKIIRGQSIGNYSWDYKTSGKGSSTSSYGSNDWTDSQLMEKLNGKYYEGEVTDSGAKGLSEIARDMIDKEIIWNIGGWNTNQVETAEMYEHERGEKVYGERPTTWWKNKKSMCK